MGNRIGIIFHENWSDFSPLFYSHNRANLIAFNLQKYIREYRTENNINDSSGHKYDPCHMMVGFLQNLDKDVHMRVSNISDIHLSRIKSEQFYSNYFEGGCFIVNISREKYGETVCCGGSYFLEYDNIFEDELKNLDELEC